MSKMFITPKTLPNGAKLSMEELLATLETPRKERRERPVVKVTMNNGVQVTEDGYKIVAVATPDTTVRELPQDQRQNKPNEQGINTVQHRGVTVAGAGKKNNGKGK